MNREIKVKVCKKIWPLEPFDLLLHLTRTNSNEIQTGNVGTRSCRLCSILFDLLHSDHLSAWPRFPLVVCPSPSAHSPCALRYGPVQEICFCWSVQLEELLIGALSPQFRKRLKTFKKYCPIYFLKVLSYLLLKSTVLSTLKKYCPIYFLKSPVLSCHRVRCSTTRRS